MQHYGKKILRVKVRSVPTKLSSNNPRTCKKCRLLPDYLATVGWKSNAEELFFKWQEKYYHSNFRRNVYGFVRRLNGSPNRTLARLAQEPIGESGELQ
jgi:hypothetical protein